MSGIFRWFDAQILERLRLHSLTFIRDALVIAACFTLSEYLRFYPKAIPTSYSRSLVDALPVIIFVYTVLNYIFGIHRRLWKYAGVPDFRALIEAVFLATVIIGVVDLAWQGIRPLPFGTIPDGGLFTLMGLTFVRLASRLIGRRAHADEGWARVLIVGAGQSGQLVASDLLSNPQWRQHLVGFVDDDPGKRRRRIHGAPVLGTVDLLPELVTRHRIDIVGVAVPSANAKELDRILALAQETPARIQVLPNRGELIAGQMAMRLRDINLGDLLDRIPSAHAVNSARAHSILTGRVILVTGGAGSIGSELCRQLLTFETSTVIAVDNNETGLFHLQKELETGPLKTVLGDITDMNKMSHVFRAYRPDIVFHAAAYKHVPMLESYPEEAVFVNVQGTLNLCKLAAEHGCERFVFISTDKAVHPVNALGFSKRIGELTVRAHQGKGPIYCCVRFGNVVGSRGSALPEFIRQIEAGGPVMVTHPEVERYFMTIPEAVSLVIQAGGLAQGGELFMLDMGQPIKIVDIAKRIIRVRGLRVGTDIEIMYTGLRPGEKLTEELVFHGERTRGTENEAIVAVEDDNPYNLKELQAQIESLTGVASRGDAEAVRATLGQIALAEPVEVRKRHLGSVG